MIRQLLFRYELILFTIYFSDGVSSWEYINGESDYTAYRKLYKDTGLFQYKVIGRFDDVTARDFFEAQVSPYYIVFRTSKGGGDTYLPTKTS